MRELFSCRNCIHNAGQSLHVGQGEGYCIRHNSLVCLPEETTCKYQHRKDLPSFLVDESRSEHAAEFARFTGLVSLEGKPIQKIVYSERLVWEQKRFDAVVNALATYQKAERKWIFIQAFAGGLDGQRALVHGSLTRRYMDRCQSWTSSYRMILALVDDMKTPPAFAPVTLHARAGDDTSEAQVEASWDVFFTRLCGLQEFGWHAGLEALMWAGDRMNGSLSELDWQAVVQELPEACTEWTETIIRHATDEGAFFTQHDPGDMEL